jgi:hypothetical protein
MSYRVYLSLAFIVVGYLAGWYSLVLISSPLNSRFPRAPTNTQLIGMVFACVLAGLSWASKTLIFTNADRGQSQLERCKRM